jgi:TrmH family RNA methyltransferase
VELFNPKVVQSTMGSIFRVSLFYTDLHQIIEEIKAKQGSVYGADLEGENAFACKFNTLSALVIGSESHGIRPDIESLLSQKIFIPGAGKAESLNAGIAAGILMGQWFSTTKVS